MTWTQFVHHLSKDKIPRVTLVGPLLSRAWSSTEPTIYIDGGANFRDVASSVVSVSVGDGDSSSQVMDERLSPQKDFSDLAFVLRGLPESVVELRMLGFLGGRMDHQLANFGEIHHFLALRHAPARVDFVEGRDVMITAFAGQELKLTIQGVFSLMTFEPAAIRVSGDCDYPLHGEFILNVASSHGLSNVGRGQVLMSSPKPLFLFRA